MFCVEFVDFVEKFGDSEVISGPEGGGAVMSLGESV